MIANAVHIDLQMTGKASVPAKRYISVELLLKSWQFRIFFLFDYLVNQKERQKSSYDAFRLHQSSAGKHTKQQTFTI